MIEHIHAGIALIGDQWVTDITVEVHEGRIEAINSGLDLNGSSARRVAALIPGLVDAHCHLTFDASESAIPDPVRFNPEAIQARDREIIAGRLAKIQAAGIAAVRDLGSGAGAARAYREFNVLGDLPQVVFAGPPLTRPGGHLAIMGLEVSDASHGLKALDHLMALGATWVKVMVTGGRMTPGTDPLAVEFPEPLLSLVVKEAHERGLRVAAHALSLAGVRAALRARVDTVEHGTMIDENGAPVVEVPPDVVEGFHLASAALSPTLLKGGPRHPIPWEVRAGWVRQLWAADVPVLAGGDTGIPHVDHGSLPPVVASLGEILPPHEAIAAATVSSARFLGLENIELAVGTAPVLLGLPGDPRNDLALLTRASVLSQPSSAVKSR